MKAMIHNLSKRTKAVIAVLLSVVLVIGVIAVNPSVKANAIALNATDAGFYNIAYDVDGNTIFGSNTKIRVINQTLTEKGKSKSDAVYTTADGTTWTAAVATNYVVWDGTEDTNTFYGVYPYNAEYDEFTIPTNQSGGVQDADWMTATYTGAKSAGDVNFNFEHRMAKVTVNITKWNTEFDGENKVITAPKIYSNSAGISISYGTGTDGANVYTPVGAHTAITPVTEVENETYTAIIAPGAYDANEQFMTLTVDGQPLTVLAKASQLTDGLQPGKHYTFELTVGKDVVTLSTVSVESWANGGIIDGGVAEEVFSEINATAMDAKTLQSAVTRALQNGETDIKVTLAADASVEMFTAIRRALIDTEGVRDGSINLTLKGVTTIPGQYEYSGPSYAIFGAAILDWEMGEQEVVKELASVNLPDVTYIGERAFSNCSLTSLTAPKVQEVGQYAFYYSKLTSVELPEATAIGSNAFMLCYDLTSVKLPKATSIGEYAFWADSKITSLELTAEGEITMGTNALRGDDLGKCDLELNEDKKSAVEGTTWNGYTFANVTYTCTDGSTEHTYTAVCNGDETHTLTCTICNQTKVNHCHGGEATCQKRAVCEACGEEYGELSGHIADRATGYCTFGCGELCAVAKIALGETTTYYNTLNEFLWNEQNGATITLLKDINETAGSTEYIEWPSCVLTLDLNGFNFNRGGYELYWCGNGGNVSLVNTAEKRAGITSAFTWGSGNKFTVGGNVDIEAILIGSGATDATIDISAADFTSTTITVSDDGFNVSQITLGNYAVYDADGNVVTGELTNGVTYTIKVAE